MPPALQSLGTNVSIYFPAALAAWWSVFVTYRALLSSSATQREPTAPNGILPVLLYGVVISQLTLCVAVLVLSQYSFWSFGGVVVYVLAASLSGGLIYAVRSRKHVRMLVSAYLLFFSIYSLWVACYALPNIYSSRSGGQWVSVREVDELAASGRNENDMNNVLSAREQRRLHFATHSYTHAKPYSGVRQFMRLFVGVELIYHAYVGMGCVALYCLAVC